MSFIRFHLLRLMFLAWTSTTAAIFLVTDGLTLALAQLGWVFFWGLAIILTEPDRWDA